MAKTETVSPRLARIQAARKRLDDRIKGGHPNRKAYKARLAEYDESEKRLTAAAPQKRT